MNIELKVENVVFEVIDDHTVGINISLLANCVEVEYELCADMDMDEKRVDTIYSATNSNTPLDNVVIAALINADTGIDLIKLIDAKYDDYLHSQQFF
ncbi:TPA: hypothetical protein I7716_21225 [Vibrio vulnificus]|nr:hypothetical protein [Vibrio vulnificus]